VALKVIQQVHMATLIVRAHQPVAGTLEGYCYRRILVPLDGSQRAECVTPAVTQLAQSCGAQLLLAHIVGMPQMPRRSPLTPEDIELRDRWVARSQELAVKYLEQLQGSSFANAATRLVVSEDVIAGLHHMAEAENADLVVLSAHGYSANPQRRYGSVTSDFIESDAAPLLVIQDLTPEDLRLHTAQNSTQENQPARLHPSMTDRR
jgi:nucleotide-binding universal stress UspA family protein